MSSFSKLTPEKVYRGLDDPYWLSVNGGTVTGDVTITGNETVTNNLSVAGNVTVTGTVNNTTVEAPVTVAVSQLVTLGSATNVSVFNPSVDVPLVNGATYEVFIQARAKVLSGSLSAGDSINLNVTAAATLPTDPTAVSGAIMQMVGISADVSTGGTQYWNTTGFLVVPATGTNYLKVGMLAVFNGTLSMSGGALTTVRLRIL